MRSVLLVALTACAAREPLVEPADCGTPRTYKIDRIDLPAAASIARETSLDLNGDQTVDNQLGQVVGSLTGFFGGNQVVLDLDARATEHLARDTDWRVTVWQCPADQRLVALTEGPGEPEVADLRGDLQGPLFTARGFGGLLPLGALFDAGGTGDPMFVSTETAAIRLEDPGDEELAAVIATGIEAVAATAIVVRAMAPFVDANLEVSREHFDANMDGAISETELATAPFTRSLLAPDLTVDGVDALSFGFRMHATRVR